MNALIHYYLKVDPDDVSDEVFAVYWQRTKFIIGWEEKRLAMLWGMGRG
jgi:hypothetical protein